MLGIYARLRFFYSIFLHVDDVVDWQKLGFKFSKSRSRPHLNLIKIEFICRNTDTKKCQTSGVQCFEEDETIKNITNKLKVKICGCHKLFINVGLCHCG